jgi:anti-sigma-K factor RskA
VIPIAAFNRSSLTVADPYVTPGDELDEQALAYALLALEPDEAEQFRRRLEREPAAQRALARAQEELSWVGQSVDPVNAPQSLRERLLAEAGQPQVGAVPTSRVAEPTPIAWYRRPATWALAAAAALLLALGGWNLKLQSDVASRDQIIAQQQAELAGRDRLVRSLAGADKLVALAPTGGGQAQGAVIVPSGNEAPLLIPGGLPPLDANQVYQIWVVRGSQPISAGVFRGADQPVALTVPVRPGDAVAITIEPGPNGSPGPTRQPFALGQV